MTFEDLAAALRAGAALDDDRVLDLAARLESLGVAVPGDADLRALLGEIARLDEAVRAVQRDLEATGVPGRVTLTVPEWAPGWLRVTYGGQAASMGIVLGQPGGLDQAVMDVADTAQAIIVEEVWTGWPTCPEHGFGLHVDEGALWRCKGAEPHVVSRIGQLGEG
ncbi:hypothetical protein [Nonomuraea typhae]|uniref:hypothetical protein n=1 Tax=Nonomuraea typhae TaxID=2603600 RepID=UPI0012FCE552|nr:hypothetical protein [Nonomuraea typhae]